MVVGARAPDGGPPLLGVATPVDDRARLDRILAAYNPKYRSALVADSLPGPFYAVAPRVVFGWVSDPSGADTGAAFHGTATRWTFDSPVP
jgi:hypothetical protein